MNIGFLLPSVYTSHKMGGGRIFAPLPLGVALADGLVEKGHKVYFYASGDIGTKATVVPGDQVLTDKKLQYFQFRNRDQAEQQYTLIEIIKRDFEYDLTMRAYSDALAGKLDIVHSYHDFGAHYFNELTAFPTVYTLHDPLPQEKDTIEYERFSKFSSHNYISISNSQRKSIVGLNFVDTIYHGIDLKEYPFQSHPEDYLIHFGRIMADKGSDIAIEVAKALSISIHIATSTNKSNRSEEFYDQKIAPHIDGKKVVLEGFMDFKEKAEYIGRGKAFILPLQWEEPFGMVMIEAMACGTPVVAYNRGSVSEIVKDGITGFIIDPDDADRPGKGSHVIKKQGVEGLIEAVRKISEIKREDCRRHVEERFSNQIMVNNYEKLYKKILA